ncbi:MAG: hypothetical protein ACJA0S_000372 [Rickettsiales bacterium]|jgi:hypothetical protein
MIEINPKKESFSIRLKRSLLKAFKLMIFISLFVGAIYLIILMSVIFIAISLAFVIASFFFVNLKKK